MKPESDRAPLSLGQRVPLLIRLGMLLLITLICFSPVLQGTFTHIDDDAYVYRNDHVRQGLTLSNIGWAMQSIEVSNWHPLTWISYMLDVELFGISATPMHAMNLLLHLANCLLLFALIRRFLSLDSAFIATLVFAIHPLHVETVAWISQRKELLSFFFLLLSSHAYMTYKMRARLSAYYWSLLAFVCALMSKPMAVSFPLLLVLMDYWPLRVWPKLSDRTAITHYVLEKLPYIVLAGVACVLALVAHSFALTEASEYTLANRLVLVVLAYIEYLRQFLVPLGLTFYYPVPALELSAYFWFCLLALAGLIGSSFLFARRYPVWFTAWWWYFIALLPVIGLIKVGGQFVADRYTYLPFTGMIFAIAFLVQKLGSESRLIVTALATTVLLMLGLISNDYSRSWQHDISIARRAILRDANNPIAYYVLVKGVEVRLTQQVLDAVVERSQCLQERVDVFAGLSAAEEVCLQGTSAASVESRLVTAAQQFRDYQLEAAGGQLAQARAVAEAEELADVAYLSAIHAVLTGDREAIAASISELRELPENEMRSAALFLAYYQLGNLDAANVFLAEVLGSFDRQAA